MSFNIEKGPYKRFYASCVAKVKICTVVNKSTEEIQRWL